MVSVSDEWVEVGEMDDVMHGTRGYYSMGKEKPPSTKKWLPHLGGFSLARSSIVQKAVIAYST